MSRALFFLKIFLFSINLNGQIFYGISVENFQQGLTNQGLIVPLIRSDPSKSLGPPEMSDIETTIPNFVSLGFGGSITIKTNSVPVTVLTQLNVFETTFSFECSTYPERAKIYVSKNGLDFEFISETCGNDNTIFSLYGEIDTVNYVRIDDISDPARFNSLLIADGYDVDGIEIFESSTLSIELDFFNAKISQGFLFVNFRTLSETGTMKFQIQDSENAVDYKDLDFTFDGANNSSTPRFYEGSIQYQSFNNMVYIRLKEIDINGKSFYYNPVPVFNQKIQITGFEFYDLLGRRVSQGEFNIRYK
jgi:hypothetical protein